MITDLGTADPTAVRDAASAVTHVGGEGRDNGQRFTIALDLLEAFRETAFLQGHKMLHVAQSLMGTQGDGNHFLCV